jgi:ketosteroid isomerase-like protein
MQPLCRASDMAFLQHGLEEDQQVEIGAGEIDFIQHIAEIISLDSSRSNRHLRGNTHLQEFPMHTTRRSILALAATSLPEMAQAASTSTNPDISGLIRESEQANQALMRGGHRSWSAKVRLTDDFTLMSPLGGKPSQGTYTPEQLGEIGRFFKNGTLRQEVVQTYASADIAVLAVIEHTNVEVGGLPAQDWKLRVTLVYRRENNEWRLVHRHADPLAHGISLEQSAALGRGEGSPSKEG